MPLKMDSFLVTARVHVSIFICGVSMQSSVLCRCIV